jgi:hypothetical protein
MQTSLFGSGPSIPTKHIVFGTNDRTSSPSSLEKGYKRDLTQDVMQTLHTKADKEKGPEAGVYKKPRNPILTTISGVFNMVGMTKRNKN